MNQFQLYEEIMLNQWQPLHTMLYDGWVLRFANGYTKRANSVNPLSIPRGDIREMIKACERIYTAQRLDTVFRLTPFSQPKYLDDLLAAKNYEVIDPVSIQRLELTHIRQPEHDQVMIHQEVSDEWIDQYSLFSGVDAKHKSTMKLMLSHQLAVKGFFTIIQNGEAAACGIGMVERGVLGIYDIVTSPKYRNQGLGEQLLLHILNWGKEQGATQSVLAVLASNMPALKLYQKLGYVEIYPFWYRVKPFHADAAE